MDRFLGKRLDGRYEIHEIIGVGGMAVVYKAYDIQENKIVAVKILKEEFGSNSEFLRRFQNESKVISVLSHPNIVKVFDVSFGDNFQYIVMEYIDGITLKEYIERKQSVPWKDALYFAVQILRALQHSHDKGIVHRDIKPQNIMLLRDGTIKVTDFGIARFSRSEEMTITDKAIGSVHYISPEQAKGGPIDEKADLYSVGVLLYEMLTGKLPFDGDSAVMVAIMQLQDEPTHPREIDSSIPLGIEQITMRAMRKNPEHRYHSDAEMLRDLEEFKRNPEVDFGYEEACVDANDYEPIGDADLYSDSSIMPPETDNDYYDDEYYEEGEEKKKSPILPILAGVAAAIVIFFSCFAAWLVFNKDEIAEFDCPNLVGLNIDTAKL
ncbi:MAG: serine/threonine protein kinase, partial [Clostridia bacterium]|nr:serine/threonine protein kinase [Clostridia bacterium]